MELMDLMDGEAGAPTPRLEGDAASPEGQRFHHAQQLHKLSAPRALPPLGGTPPAVSRDALSGSAGATLRMGTLEMSPGMRQAMSPGMRQAPLLGSPGTTLGVGGMDGMSHDGSLFGARPTSMRAFIRSRALEEKAVLGAARFKQHSKALRALEAVREQKRAAAEKEKGHLDAIEAARRAREEKRGSQSTIGVRLSASLLPVGDAAAPAGDASAPASSGGSRPVTSPSRPGSQGTYRSSMSRRGSSEGGVRLGSPSGLQGMVEKRAASPSQLDIAWDALLEAERRRELEAKERANTIKNSGRKGAEVGDDADVVEAAGPPPPPQKEEEQPPSPPKGRPPRVLNK